MFKRLGRWIDAELDELDLTRADFRIRFKFRGKRYYYEAFTPPWWILSTTAMGLTTASIYCLICGLILMAP